MQCSDLVHAKRGQFIYPNSHSFQEKGTRETLGPSQCARVKGMKKYLCWSVGKGPQEGHKADGRLRGLWCGGAWDWPLYGSEQEALQRVSLGRERSAPSACLEPFPSSGTVRDPEENFFSFLPFSRPSPTSRLPKKPLGC